MSETLNFITTKRDHIIDIAQTLVDGLQPRLTENGTNPKTTILLNGGATSGKSLIAAAAHHSLFEENKSDCTLTFKAIYLSPEQNRDTKPLFGFSNYAYDILLERIEEQKLGTKNALLFAQNEPPAFFRENHGTPDIEIFIGQHLIQNMYPCPDSIKKLCTMPAEFSFDFYCQVERHGPQWTRFIEIKVNSDDIANRPQMKIALNTLSQKNKTDYREKSVKPFNSV